MARQMTDEDYDDYLFTKTSTSTTATPPWTSVESTEESQVDASIFLAFIWVVMILILWSTIIQTYLLFKCRKQQKRLTELESGHRCCDGCEKA